MSTAMSNLNTSGTGTTGADPIQGFELELLKGGSIGGGDAMALYDMPDTVQEAFAVGFNRRGFLDRHVPEAQRPVVRALQEALASFVALTERLQSNVRDPAMLQAIVNQGSTGHAYEVGRSLLSSLQVDPCEEHADEAGRQADAPRGG